MPASSLPHCGRAVHVLLFPNIPSWAVCGVSSASESPHNNSCSIAKQQAEMSAGLWVHGIPSGTSWGKFHAVPGSWCSAECAPRHPCLLAGWVLPWEAAPGVQSRAWVTFRESCHCSDGAKHVCREVFGRVLLISDSALKAAGKSHQAWLQARLTQSEKY